MKVEPKKEFTPVTVTFESKEELESVLYILSLGLNEINSKRQDVMSRNTTAFKTLDGRTLPRLEAVAFIDSMTPLSSKLVLPLRTHLEKVT